MGLSISIVETFRKSFETRCVTLLVTAYNTSIANADYLVSWDENDFTSMLEKSLEKDPQRVKWQINCTTEKHLHENVIQNYKGYANKESRIDMRLSTFSSTDEYFFYIEAKRLKESDNRLLKRYVDTGIDHYLTKKYPQGVLLGYLVEGRIDNTVQKVNGILVKNNRANEILVRKPHNIHDQYFESTHYDFGVISHFVFDFTV